MAADTMPREPIGDEAQWGTLTARESMMAAARDDARTRLRKQKQREERGEGFNPATGYTYAVYLADCPQHLVGFIHGHLTIKRMRRLRRKLKIGEDPVLIFTQIFLAAMEARVS